MNAWRLLVAQVVATRTLTASMCTHMHLCAQQCVQLAGKLGAARITVGGDAGGGNAGEPAAAAAAAPATTAHWLSDQGMLDLSPGAQYPTNRARHVEDESGNGQGAEVVGEEGMGGGDERKGRAKGDDGYLGDWWTPSSPCGQPRVKSPRAGQGRVSLAHALCDAQDYQRLFDAQTPLTCSSLTRAIQTAALSVRDEGGREGGE